MSAGFQADDQDKRLLKSILQQIDELADSESGAAHLDEETMALFSAGGLKEDDRLTTIQHLAECPVCREAASLLLTLDKTTPLLKRDGNIRLLRLPRTVFVAAVVASVLILIGLVFLLPNQGNESQTAEQTVYEQVRKLVLSGRFADAQTVLAEAKAQGVRSGRLSSLAAQSIRKIPQPVALAFAGRLSNFGYDIGGVVARSPGTGEENDTLQAAHELLAAAGSNDREVLLNRGHVLLSLDRNEEAITEFRAATRQFPNETLAWLGQGLALFLTDDFAGAESAFRESARLDSSNLAAQINLAMSLEEQDEFVKALAIWRSLLTRQVSSTEREKIQLQVEQLQRLQQ